MIVQNENQAESMLPVRAFAVNIYHHVHVHSNKFTFSKQAFRFLQPFITS